MNQEKCHSEVCRSRGSNAVPSKYEGEHQKPRRRVRIPGVPTEVRKGSFQDRNLCSRTNK